MLTQTGMSVYGHPLFWSAVASVLGAVVVCTLVVRYGFTRDADAAGRWGWRPTRVGHGVAAALFGTGIALAILALTAVPLGGKEGHPFGDTLRVRLEALRGRLGAFEGAVARLGDEGMRRVLTGEPQRPVLSRAGEERAGDARRGGGHAVVAGPPALPRTQPAPSVEPRPDRTERRRVRPEPPPVVVIAPARPAPVEISSPPVTAPPPHVARAEPPAATPAPRDHDADLGKANHRDADVVKPVERGDKHDEDKPRGVEPRGRTDVDARERVERPKRRDRGERFERPDRLERSQRFERAERVERPERIERPERGGRR